MALKRVYINGWETYAKVRDGKTLKLEREIEVGCFEWFMKTGESEARRGSQRYVQVRDRKRLTCSD